MLPVNRIHCFALCTLMAITATAKAEQGLSVILDGKRKTIAPLGYDTRNVVALQRNGFLLNLRLQELGKPKVVSGFQPFSQQEMRAELLHEFGRSFEVTGTGNYLVVHPKGARDLWANRFEQLYRSMVHFFRSRGFAMNKPKYPCGGRSVLLQAAVPGIQPTSIGLERDWILRGLQLWNESNLPL